MSILSAFCPVKGFGYLIKSDRLSSVTSTVGSVVAVAGLSGSVILGFKGFKEWAKPAVIVGLVGTATAILALETKRLRTEVKLASDCEDDVIKAIEYLTTYYWLFWEEKMHNESEIIRQSFTRPNIPSEFAFAFGNALLKALELKIRSRYGKICNREGDKHPEKWEFRNEMGELELLEKDLWAKTRISLEQFRIGPKAFNRQKEDLTATRPILYCTLIGLLRDFHPKYRDVLLKARAEKLEMLNQQMKEPTYKLPVIPDTFSVSTSTNTEIEIVNLEVPVIEVAAEAVEVNQTTGAEAFMVSDDNPVVLDRYEHICLAEEPSARLYPAL